MRNLQFVSIISALGLLTACGGEIQTLQIEPYKVACMGFVTQMCLVTQNETDTQPTLEYDWIEGFEYEWGKRYEIITETTEISDPPADGSSQRVELVEVVKAEAVERQAARTSSGGGRPNASPAPPGSLRDAPCAS